MVKQRDPTFIAFVIGVAGVGMTALLIVFLGWFAAFVFGLAGLLIAFLIDHAENDVRGDLPRNAAIDDQQVRVKTYDPTEPEVQERAIPVVKIVSGAIVLTALVTWHLSG